MYCVHCKSKNITGNGFTPKGKHRLLCRECGRTWSDAPDERGMSPAEQSRALSLQRGGLSMRAIARELDKGASTVLRFFKKSETRRR